MYFLTWREIVVLQLKTHFLNTWRKKWLKYTTKLFSWPQSGAEINFITFVLTFAQVELHFTFSRLMYVCTALSTLSLFICFLLFNCGELGYYHFVFLILYLNLKQLKNILDVENHKSNFSKDYNTSREVNFYRFILRVV